MTHSVHQAMYQARKKHFCRGYTLTELMVAVTLGTILVIGATQSLINARATTLAAEHRAALDERAAYALALLEDDIVHAGYWGLHSRSAAISGLENANIHCGGNDVSSWALQVGSPVSASNNSYNLPCRPYDTPVAQTDVLIIRRASVLPVATRANRTQLLSSQDGSLVFSNAQLPADVPNSQVHNYETTAWYVDRSSSETGLPALRRFQLVHNGLLQNQEIMPGITDLQVTLNADTNADGIPDGFIEPDTAGSATVHAVKLKLRLSLRLNYNSQVSSGPHLEVERIVSLRNAPGNTPRTVIEAQPDTET